LHIPKKVRIKMKNNVLRQISFLVFVGVFLVACCTNPPPIIEESSEDMIPNLFGKNIVLATGIDFQSGKSIVLNPVTGDKVKPCNSLGVVVNSGKYIQQTLRQQRLLGKAGANAPSDQEDCNAQIVDPNPELTNAIKSSENIINGTIRKRKGGKDIDVNARFVVTVTALYEGSDCIDVISAGSQYEHCTTLKDDCNFVLPLKRYGKKSESVRKNVRKACGQQPTPPGVIPSPPWRKIWRDSDCNNLRPVYRTSIPTIPGTTSSGPVTYSLTYKQHVWDTCHLVPPLTWGNRP
jgi:hypothetical protein